MKKRPRMIKKSEDKVRLTDYDLTKQKMNTLENNSVLDNKKIRDRMDNICRAMEGSIQKGMSLEDAVKQVLESKSSFTLFLSAYIQEYKKRMAFPTSKQYKTDGITKDRIEIVIGGKSVNYLSDEQALADIYENYLNRKREKDSKGDIDEPQ